MSKFDMAYVTNPHRLPPVPFEDRMMKNVLAMDEDERRRSAELKQMASKMLEDDFKAGGWDTVPAATLEISEERRRLIKSIYWGFFWGRGYNAERN